MDRVVKLLNGSIDELEKLEEEIGRIDEKELDQLSSSYPFNDYFHEVVSGLKKWKNGIEKSELVSNSERRSSKSFFN